MSAAAADPRFDAAAAHHRAGRLAEARAILAELVAADPRDAEGRFRLALVLADAGDLAGAEREARAALSLAPRGAFAFLLGDLLEREARAGEAIAAFRQATQLDPRLAPAHARLGRLAQESGDLAAALASYRAALALDARDARTWNNLAAALLALPDAPGAEAAARAALAIAPGHAQALFNLARSRLLAGDRAAAEESLSRSIAADGSNAAAHELLGTVFMQQGRLTRAAEALGRAVALEPGNALAWNRLGNCLGYQGRTPESIAAYRRAVEAGSADAAAIHSNILFAMQYDGRHGAGEIFAEHLAWARRHAPGRFPRPERRDPGRGPLRVGYLSPRFHRSSAAFLIVPVIEAHDPRRVEVHCYANQEIEDEVSRRIRARSRWRNVLALDDAALAEAIRGDGIDILVDLAGHTPGHRLTALARRPAPVAMVWLDYFNTTGLEAVDYLVSDAVHSPPGDPQPFVEEVLRLPRTRFCYEPPAYAPPAAPPRPRAPGEVVFASFGRLSKVSPATLAAWGEVLRRLPHSRLVVKNAALDHPEEHAAHRERFAREGGIDPARLELRGSSSHEAMLAEYAEADLVLDTFPYNGGITTLEALWMGRPVVALRGDALIGRQSAALLSAIGLPELVAEDAEAFAELAEALARDPGRRHALSTGLRERMRASPVCDAPGFTRELEDLYAAAWRRESPRCP